jgi:hypothetical protein
MSTVQDVIARVRGEFLEMPGLRLTREQVQRLCGIDPAVSQLALESLLASRFLCVKADGHYVRTTEGAIPRPHPAKAAISTGTSYKVS